MCAPPDVHWKTAVKKRELDEDKRGQDEDKREQDVNVASEQWMLGVPIT